MMIKLGTALKSETRTSVQECSPEAIIKGYNFFYLFFIVNYFHLHFIGIPLFLYLQL